MWHSVWVVIKLTYWSCCLLLHERMSIYTLDLCSILAFLGSESFNCHCFSTPIPQNSQPTLWRWTQWQTYSTWTATASSITTSLSARSILAETLTEKPWTRIRSMKRWGQEMWNEMWKNVEWCIYFDTLCHPWCPLQVSRQVSQCNCPKRFQVEQISANRYRVSPFYAATQEAHIWTFLFLNEITEHSL